MKLPILLNIGILAAGCVSHASDDLVDFAVSGGFSGQGDGTALHIEADGTATRTTRDGGTQTIALDAATLGVVRRKISDAPFPTLASSYGCSCADEFVYNLTVPLDGNTYKVDATTVPSGHTPAPVVALIGTLRDIIQGPYAVPL
jgi:hypothetical protein